MNKIYKIVWSKIKNTYVVVSEVAKSHSKSGQVRGRVTLAAAVLGVLMATTMPTLGVYAADLTADQKAVYDAVLHELENKGVHYVSVKGESQNDDSNYKNDGAKGNGAVAIGEKAMAAKGGTVSIGRNAQIKGNGGNASGEGSVAIGDNTLITTNGLDLASIAIGKNAKVLNGSGKQERGLSFTPDNFDKPGFFGRGNTLPKNADKVPGGIAIGTNSYARTGSIQLGHHTFDGYKMGGIDVTKANEEANIVGMTTVGTNTYNKGALANMYGAYSIITGDFTGAGGENSWTYGPQNFGANVVGSLNSIRSKGHSGSSGVANSIVGVANTVENANGTLVYGAGNKITNSIKAISAEAGFTTLKDWEDTVTGLQKVIKNSKSGGAVLAIGGGNVADYVRHSQLVGVNNTVTGTENKVSEFNMVNGYQNTVKNGMHVTMIGSDNEVNDTTGAVLLGDKRKLTGADGSIVLGSANESAETNVKDATVIGHNANTTVASGVALGSGSVADRAGFTEEKKGVFSDVDLNGKTDGAVSVGTKDKLRQIINVGDATEDTDAVNLRQLRALGSKVDNSAIHYFSVKSKDQMANYDNKGAKGANSVAIGPGSTTKFRNGLSVGTNNVNEGYETTVVGSLNKAYGMGDFKYASDATIVGTGNTIMGYEGVMALGSGNIVHEGIAVGAKNKAMGENAVALGNFSSAMYTDSIGIGFGTHSYADDVIAIGRAAAGDALGGVAIGREAEVHASTGVALGFASTSERKAGVIGYMPGAVGQTAEEVAAYLGKAEEYKSWKADVEANKDAYTRANAWHDAVAAERKAHNEVNEARVAYAENSTEANEKAITEKYDAWKKAEALREKTDQDTRQDRDTIDKLNARYGQIFGKLMSTGGAVSVGNEKEGITRQIVNVAAGTKDTDAVNVYQLKAVESKITQTSGEAQKHTSVTAGTNISVTEDGTNNEGGKNYKVSLAKDIDLGQDGSVKAGNTTINKDGVTTNTVKAGDTTINKDGLTIKKGPSVTTGGINAGDKKITKVADGDVSENSTDAVNGGQLYKLQQTVAGNKVTVEAAKNSQITVTPETQADKSTKYVVDIAKDGTIGGDKDGNLVTGDTVKKYVDANKVTVTGDEDGSGVKVENVAKNGEPANYKVSLGNKIKAGDVTVDGTEGKGQITGLSNKTWDAGNIVSGRAATEDQLKAVSQNAAEAEKKHTTVVAGDYVTVSEGTNANGGKEYTVTGPKVAVAKEEKNLVVGDIMDGNKKVGYELKLNKELTGLTSVSSTTFKAGDNVTINNEGLTIEDGPSVTTAGIDAGKQKITNVADGEKDSDAVNVKQLNAIANQGNQSIAILGGKVIEVNNRVNRVGAGAASLAALHPLDFDPDDKWDFAAGYGNYKGANAVAIGAYYRPNEDTMFSVGGSFGGGENMVNAGVSVKLGQGNHVSTSKVAMAKDMLAMQKRMAEMEAQMAKMQGFIGALTGVDTQTAMFPDVPENHWAYEYVKGLCEKGIIKGYPDGNFNGNRSMTRYEFAAMLYRALAKGVNLDARAVKEFAPELGRIRVDVISQNKEGQPVIERVRVNEEKKEK